MITQQIQDEELYKQAQMVVKNCFSRNKLIFIDNSQIIATLHDPFMSQMFTLMQNYCQTYRSHGFWDYVVIQGHTNKKIQHIYITNVSKQCYQLIYSWVKAGTVTREAKIALCLTVRQDSISIIKFYLKCRKTIESFYGRPIRQEYIRLDQMCITMDTSIMTFKRLFSPNKQEEVNQAYYGYLKSLQLRLVARDEVPLIDFLMFCLMFWQSQNTSEFHQGRNDSSFLRDHSFSPNQSPIRLNTTSRSTSLIKNYVHVESNAEIKHKNEALQLTKENQILKEQYAHSLKFIVSLLETVNQHKNVVEVLNKDQQFVNLMTEYALMSERNQSPRRTNAQISYQSVANEGYRDTSHTGAVIR